MIDPRIDPTARTNSEAFCVGYFRFREGVWYTELPEGEDYLAGWCFGLTEHHRRKRWWQTKRVWLGVVTFCGALFAAYDPTVITAYPRAAAGAAATIGALLTAFSTALRSEVE